MPSVRIRVAGRARSTSRSSRPPTASGPCHRTRRRVGRTRARRRSSALADAVELDGLWDFADPAASEERFRAFAERARAAGVPILAESLTQLARAQGLQGRFDEADRTLSEAEAALRPDDVRGRIRLDLERGRVANT